VSLPLLGETDPRNVHSWINVTSSRASPNCPKKNVTRARNTVRDMFLASTKHSASSQLVAKCVRLFRNNNRRLSAVLICQTQTMFQKFSPEYVLSWWIMLQGSHNQCIQSWFWMFSHHFSYFLSRFLNVYYLSVLFNVPGVHLTAWPWQNREQDCVPIIITVNCGHSSKGGSPAAQTVPLSV